MTTMRNARIILLTSSYPSALDAINKSFMSDLAVSLARKSIRVFIVCPHKPGLPLYEIQEKITVVRFPYWFSSSGQRLGKKGGVLASLEHSPIAMIQIIPFCICQFLVAWSILRKEKITLIHSHWIIPQGLVGAMIRLLTGIPHVTSIHGTDIHIIHSHRWLYPLMRVIMHFSDCITTNSSHTNHLLREISNFKINDSRIIPMGIHMNEFSKPISSDKLKGTSILFVGRLIAWKGVIHLIKAMKILHSDVTDVYLNIIGDGPERAQLEHLANNLQISSVIHFLGNVERNDLLLYYRKADVFVLPSVTVNNQTEGLGVVLLEAMASGVPVIGSNTGGIPDIIKDGVNGLLVPPGNPDALAAAIKQILKNPELADQFRKEGLETVKERFSWDIIADQFIKTYQQAMNETDSNVYR